jgi:rRNA maturation protein Rpf1
MDEDDPLVMLKARLTRRAFKLFDQNFTKYMAVTISLTEAIPDQINNHIRNAFTHLSRACFANDKKDVEDEVNRAISHIERANRDCLKVSVLEQHDRLKSIFADIRFFHGFITPSIKSKYDNITQLRERSYEDEVRGDKNATDKLETLLRCTNELVEEIDNTYISIGLKRGRLRYADLFNSGFVQLPL